MASPTIPRTPIPKFNLREIKQAELCARALWYGIDFETAKLKTSDSEFIEVFAGPMYTHAKYLKMFNPAVFQKDVHELMKTGRLIALYRMILLLDFNKAVRTIHNQIFKLFFDARKKPASTDKLKAGIKTIELLSNGFVKNSNNNQLVLASRVMFYLAPNLTISNMNNAVAKHFGLQSRPHHHYKEFQQLFKQGLITNQTNLNKCKFPMQHGKMDIKLWEHVKKTDWYQRRVLDLAVLIRLNLAKPAIGLANDVKDFEKKLTNSLRIAKLLAAKKKARKKGAAAVKAVNL
jgi:hypothetical protein